MVRPDDRYVLLRAFADQAEAHLAKQVLEQEGVSVILEGVQGASMFGGASLGGGEARLLVREDDAARATGMLADIEARVELSGDWEHEATRGYVCLLCGEAVEEGRPECPSCKTPCESVVPAVRIERPVPPPAVDAFRPAAQGVTGKGPSPEAPGGVPRPGCLWLLAHLLPF